MSVDYNKDNRRRFLRLQSAAYAELLPIDGLKIRTQFSVRLGGYWDYLDEQTYNHDQIKKVVTITNYTSKPGITCHINGPIPPRIQKP